MAGVYESRAVSYIELVMDETASSDQRQLPTPRIRRKPKPLTKIKHQTIIAQKPTMPQKIVTPKVPAVNHSPVNLPSMPDRLDVSGLSVHSLAIASAPASSAAVSPEARIEFTTAKDYFEMLNLKIHSAKLYPDSARERQIEGRVRVQFILKADGSLSDVSIVKSSRHRNLDNAALKAVKKASPFPRPPSFLFTPPVTLQISILFELA